MGDKALSGSALVSFAQLGLGFGEQLQLVPIPADTKSRFACELVGCLGMESIIIGPPASGLLPQLEEGQRVVVKANLAAGVAVFPSTVLCVSSVPALMVYLDYPRDIKFKQMRAAFRVDVTLPVLVTNRSIAGGNPCAGKLVDISVRGARLELFEPLGDVGDSVQLKGKFQVGDIQRILSIDAVIRTASMENASRYYGIEFRPGDEDSLLVLMGYTFHAMAFGHVQSIR